MLRQRLPEIPCRISGIGGVLFWASAWAVILRFCAGQVVCRKAKRVWPSGHRTSRGKTKFFPDLFRAPGGVPCRDGHTFFGPVSGRPYFLCLCRPNAAGQRKAPLVQRGDSMAQPCKGGLTALNCLDDTSCQVWDLVAGCPQSLSRRSPTAPFAQGSRLCCLAPNQPGFCCRAR